MKPTPAVKGLALVCVLVGAASLWAGLTLRAEGAVVCAPLLYREVAAGTLRTLLIVQGVASLAVAGLLFAATDIAVMMLMAGLAWDVVCEVAGLAQGRMFAGLLLVVDLVLLAALASMRKNAD